MVVAHVLIHGQCDTRLLTQFDNLLGFAVVQAHWLLGQHASNVVVVLNDFSHHFQLHIRRHSHIDNFEFRIGEQFLVGRIDLGQRMAFGNSFCVDWVPRRNRDRIEARLAIRDQMAIGHDETGADTANRNVFVLGQRGQVRNINRHE